MSDNPSSATPAPGPQGNVPAMPLPVPQPTLLGLTLGDYVRMVGTCLLGIVATSFLFWLTTKAPYLRQTPPMVIAYAGKSKIGIYAFTVTNDGSKEAEDVVCTFDCPECNIKEVTAIPPALSPGIEGKDSHATVKVALLNPREFLTVWVIVDRPEKLLQKCDLSVRGRGVVGEVTPINNNTSMFNLMVFFGFIGCITVPTTVFFIVSTVVNNAETQRRKRNAVARRKAAAEKRKAAKQAEQPC